jgi:hypothetical protein
MGRNTPSDSAANSRSVQNAIGGGDGDETALENITKQMVI